ncbi:MAG: tRNA uridine(34) 5-carboxymethylaminomethyl modification radical SAM/GNAT enzyme Elp3 [Candidatus Thorarchaeota archaeon]|jgi:elongator complex protein 3
MSEKDGDYTLYREIIDAILSSEVPVDKKVVNRIKNKACAKYRRSKTPSNADILQASIPEEAEILRPILQKRPVRTVSGVAVVAVMTQPHACPHGKCAYCPGGPDLGVPQSYTGHEPATMRGIQNEFDPYMQTQGRLNQLHTIGHSINKVELIVMGGDWCSKDPDYREDFVKGCLDAMNGSIGTSLNESMKANETTTVRNVGLTFETRPDWVNEDTVNDMLRMGATRVELGVQTLSDDILEHVQRGHGVGATVKATQLLRDSGLKVCYHMMPGLPGSSPESDLEDFVTLFSDSQFQPDMLKIYPTIVVKNTQLYDWWTKGEYTPYDSDQIIDLVSRAVNKMPEYVRIQRMQRDIPLHQVEAGLNKGNLRELVNQEMDSRKLRNPTIRYREIGHFQMRSNLDVNPTDMKLVRRNYTAADGTETFLSFEHPKLDIIFGFLRLRVPSNDTHRQEISSIPSTIIRELRVYGPVVNLGERDADAWQHLGLGEKLIDAADEIGRNEFDAKQIVVNSGIGVKEYYRNLGFEDVGPYLAKKFTT